MSDDGQQQRPPRPPKNPAQRPSTSAEQPPITARRIADIGVRNPTWSVTRRHRTEMSPSPGSRADSGSRERDGSGERTGDAGGRASSGEPYYRSRTITSTERVQILQMPLELTDENAERLRYLTMSPTSEASRQVSSTTTVFEAGGTPIIGAIGANGVPLISGIFLNRDCRQTTTIITTTTTTYKLIEDDQQSQDDFELVNMQEEEAARADELTVDMPLGVNRTKQQKQKSSNFVFIGSSTDSSPIVSTSEEESDDVSIVSTGKFEDDSKTLKTEDEDVTETAIRDATHHDEFAQTSPIGGGSNANTSTFSSISPSSEEDTDFVHLHVTEREPDYHLPRRPHHGIIDVTYLAPQLIEEPMDKYIEMYMPEQSLHTHNRRSQKRIENDQQPAQAVVEEATTTTTTKVDPFHKLTGLFKRSSVHEDYPHSAPFEGHLTQTSRVHEVPATALDTHVSVYHAGRSDEIVHVPQQLEPTPSEAEKKPSDTLGRISSLFRKSAAHDDYPLAFHYDGPTTSTHYANELHAHPIDHHVSVCHSGKSDEHPHPPPAVAESTKAESGGAKADPLSKLTGLFKRSSAHEDYPHSAPFEGTVTSTSRAYEVGASPLDSHVSVYHKGRSDEVMPVQQLELTPSETEKHKPTDTLGRISSLFRKSTAHEDYPLAVHYDGPTTSTNVANEIEAHPLDHHVSVYHSGKSDEAVLPAHVVEMKPESATTKADPFSKLTGFFKRSSAHEDYPHSQPFDGHLHQTSRAYEVDGTPLDTHVSVYHSGKSDEAVQQPAQAVVEEATTTTTTKVDPFHKLTGLFKRSSAHEDYPHSAPFEGHLTQTSRVHEVPATALDTHVSVYHAGRSDEVVHVPQQLEPTPSEAEKKPSDTLGRISSLFRKSAAHDDYPLAFHYDGPTTSTHYANELHAHPIDHHVSVYHSGKSDEHPHPPPAVADSTKAESGGAKADPLSKLTGLFKRSSAHEDYPHSAPFEGTVTSTSRAYEVGASSLDSHVSVYHKGRSDEVMPVQQLELTPSETEKHKPTDTLGRISSLFRKSTAHEDYPLAVHYDGPTISTNVANEIEAHPLDHHVSVYHSGKSDEAVLPAHVVEMKPESATTKADPFSKLTGFFKRSSAHEDYPHSQPFDGHLHQTSRAYEVDGTPLDTHVSVYHSGKSDEAVQQPAQAVVEEASTTTTTKVDPFHKLTGLFKRSSAHEDYPHSAPFEGHLTQTSRVHEVPATALDTHVSVYHAGRSDEVVHVPQQLEPTPSEAEKKPSDTLGRISSLFRKSAAHDDYPLAFHYDGPTTSTRYANELHAHPIDHHVSVYHSGKSDEHPHPPPAVADSTKAENGGAKADPLSKLTGLFKRSSAHEDYPHSAPYEGTVTSTSRAYEVGASPLDSHVSVYHKGRSDEVMPVQQLELTPSETEKHKPTDTLGRISSLFRKSTAHEDYPLAVHYDGPTTSTNVANEIEAHPLDHHVSVYHSGKSDEAVLPAHVVEMKPESATTKADPFSKLTGFFKRSSAHEDYPHSQPFDGHLHQTSRAYEVNGTPLDTHVSVYHSGKSDEAVQQPAQAVVEEASTTTTTKVDPFHKLTGLFKRSSAHEDYPHSAPFEGHLTQTSRVHEVPATALDTHVSVYHAGRSDEVVHVPQQLEPTPSEAEKKPSDTLGRISSMFRKSAAHDDYPLAFHYDGPTTSTHYANELHAHPIDHHVSVYHSGKSDEHPHPPPAVADSTKAESGGAKADPLSKLTGLFKRSSAHEDYPHSAPFEGTVTSTSRAYEVGASPLDSHVSVYHKGRSDEVMPVQQLELTPSETEKHKPTDTLGRISSLFRKSTAHEDYPLAVHYDGPTTSTNVANEIEAHPLDHHVSVYHSGKSDEAVLPAHVVEMKPESATTKADPFSKLTGFFKRSSAHEDYPHSQPFDGHLHQTSRAYEVNGTPLDTHVSVYHSGKSDEAVQQPAQAVVEEASTTTTTKVDPFHKLTGLFKRSSAHEDYPHSAPFEGHLTQTSRVHEVPATALDTHVSVYHAGRSDEVVHVPQQLEPTPSEAEKKPSDTLGRISSLFRKSAAHDDYPLAFHYDGPTTSTHYANELHAHPIDHHVSVYHSGKSDEHPHPPPAVADSTKAENGGAKADPLSKLTGLFKRSSAHEDYPHSAPYEGTVTSTSRAYEVGASPLDSHVSVYHKGRSDEVMPVQQLELTPSETEKHKPTDTLGRISSLFRKSTAHEDYPLAVHYDGPTTSTNVANEIEAHPLDHHVSVYHSGKSDEAVLPAHVVEMKPESATTKADPFSKLTGFFKRSSAHEDYPHSQPFDGHLHQTSRAYEVDGTPLDTHVSVYHSGKSDEAVQQPAQAVVEEASTTTTTKVDPFHKLTGLFKRSSAHEDYPHSAPFEGHLTQTSRVHEVPATALDTHVSVYHAGRSDEVVHVPQQLEPTPSEAEKKPSDTLGRISSLLRKSAAHDDYPLAFHYDGPTTSTHYANELHAHPIDHHVSVYHSGKSDEHPHPPPAVADSTKAENGGAKADPLSKLTGLFKRSSAHEDYPHSAPYEGTVTSTSRAYEGRGDVSDVSGRYSKNQLDPSRDLKWLSLRRDLLKGESGHEILNQEKMSSHEIEDSQSSHHNATTIFPNVERQQLRMPSRAISDQKATVSFGSEGAANIDYHPPRRRYSKEFILPKTRTFGTTAHAHDYKSTVGVKTSKSYTDNIFRSLSPSSKNGWTTVTETTTITYAKRTSTERVIGGRKQHITEDVIVHNYNSCLPPLSPASAARRAQANRSPATRPAIPDRYYNVDQRYQYYRSRSQDPLTIRTDDKWMQTDFDAPYENTWRRVGAGNSSRENAAEDTRRHSRSMNRAATADVIQTYRSYSSHLYNRHAYFNDYHQSTSPRRVAGGRVESTSPPMRRVYHGRNQFGRDSSDKRDELEEDAIQNRSSKHSRSSPGKFPSGIHERADMRYQQQQRRQTPTQATTRLMYQRSNLEELPIDQLFSRFDEDDNGVHRNGRSTTTTVVPLETRLMEPGHYRAERHHRDRSGSEGPVPMRRARQRVRNYCAML